MKIVTFTTLYPNREMPRHGIFVEERLRHLLATGEVEAEVIAPVPWFPFASRRFGRYATFARVPTVEHRLGIRIQHPRYLSIPKLGMSAAPVLLALGVLPAFRAIPRGSGLLIDCHYLYPDGVAGALLGRWLGLPVIMTARGQDVTLIPKSTVPRNWIRWAARHCDKIITVSHALRERLIALGVRAETVVTLRNGVDTRKFIPLDRNLCRMETAIGSNTLLAVGNLIPLKRHHLIIRALTELPEFHLIIIGEGPSQVDLVRLAASLGVAPRLRIVPNVSQQELVKFYNAADFLVMPSEREGMPNVVLESLACGTPVIAAAVGGIPEVVNVPAAGMLLAEPSAASIAKAVRTLVARPVDRGLVRAHGETLGWDPTVIGLLDMLRAVSH